MDPSALPLKLPVSGFVLPAGVPAAGGQAGCSGVIFFLSAQAPGHTW